MCLSLQLSVQVNLHSLFLLRDTRHDLIALVLLSLIFGLSSSWMEGIKFIPGLPIEVLGFFNLLKIEGHQPLPDSLNDLNSMPQVFQNAQMIPLIWHPVYAALYILASIGTCHIQSISCAQMHLSFLLLLVLCHQQRKVKLIFI